MNPNQKEFAELVAALQRLEANHRKLVLEVEWADVTVIVCQLQLALGHSGNRGYTAQRCRSILYQIIGRIARLEPQLGALLRRRADPHFHVAAQPAVPGDGGQAW